MFRIDDATAATSLPNPESAGSEGFFTEGNPAAGTPATNVRGSWLNMIQEELCSILAAAGIARSKTSYSQVNASLQKMYSSVVGTVRNLAMTVTAASATATLTADQIVVASALNGQTFILSSFSKTINLATTGAGGMDTGTAPVSGFVALYAIFNPTTQTAALLATNATSAVAPSVYGGANVPSGYTASALLSVLPTNSSSQFAPVLVQDRKVSILQYTALTSSATGSTGALALSISGGVPRNAKRVSGSLSLSNSTSANSVFVFWASSFGAGAKQYSINTSAGGGNLFGFDAIDLSAQQSLQYGVLSVSAGTLSYIIYLSSYEV